jgi:hypothetical protein
MDEQILRQIFDELFESLEPLDTQTAALLQFLKSKGIVTDEELAPFLKQAGDASSVRWLGARIRAEALISSALRPPDIAAGQTGHSESAGAQPADAGNADADSATEATKNEATNKEKAEEGHQPQSQTEASRKEAAEKNSTQAETEQDDSDLNSDLSDPPLFPARKNKNKDKDKNEAA